MANHARATSRALCVALVACVACVRAPYTDRAQLMLVSDEEASQLGQQAFRQVLAESRVVATPAVVEPVRELGERIASAAAARHPAPRAARWEFAVLDDPEQQNAFALPGGKVAVYTGLFPVAEDTAGLAVVVAHEVGHVLARHGSERLSQRTLQQLGGGLLGALFGDTGASSAVLAAYGLGTQVGILLPYGRTQESEADRVGLLLMAEAGYEPERALRFWQRMEDSARGGGKAPELLSTHPAPATRLEQIRRWLPEAQAVAAGVPRAPVRPLPAVGHG